MLNFLRDNATPKETLSGISMGRTVTSGRERVNRSDLLARQSELMEKAISAFEAPASTEQKEKSDDQVFSEMVLTSIEKVPESEYKEELKIRARRRSTHLN